MGFGPLELGLVVPAAVPLALGGWLAWRSRPDERAPMPWLALLVCGGGVVPALGGGALLGPVLHDRLMRPGLVFTFGPSAARAQLACAACVALGLALPFIAAASSLVLSRQRSARQAATLGVAVLVGYPTGACALLWVLGDPMQSFAESGARMDIGEFVVAMAWALGAAGLAGATFAGVAAVAGRSKEALRTMAIATLGLPLYALGIGAAASPPDVVTQVLLAAPIVACWVVGLAVGAGLVALRERMPAV